jgi:hypothetical protein
MAATKRATLWQTEESDGMSLVNSTDHFGKLLLVAPSLATASDVS